mmetsp:Transcript_40173/g.97034  ORF Transcript_40173/g.97034 Transcript_40173/m.97034 type:complete len:395 (+) Transcript_40173:305-1489(+)
MTKRTNRDPNAPKRNMSAYLLFQNAMRDEFKSRNPDMSFGQLAKFTSAMYAQLPPMEKDTWVSKAEADKARYLQELSGYIPPPGFDPKGDALENHHQEEVKGRKGKTLRDANAPKRNLSAYLLYQNAMRDTFKRENPGMTFGQLAKFTSHMYKNMTAEEKASWEAKAAQDKARYDAEIASYYPPPGHDAKGVLIDTRPPRKKQKRPPKDPSAPKRASGAYVFFTNDMRPQVMREYPGIKFVELGKVLGERWRALTQEQKKRYEGMAAQDKQRFQAEMEHYTANRHQQQHQQSQSHHPHVHHQEDDEAAVVNAAVASVAGLPMAGHGQDHHHHLQHGHGGQHTYDVPVVGGAPYDPAAAAAAAAHSVYGAHHFHHQPHVHDPYGAVYHPPPPPDT